MEITGKIIDVYVVHDDCGHGKWVLTDKDVAEKVSYGRGEWGGKAMVEKTHAFMPDLLSNKVRLLLPDSFALDVTPDDVALKKANALAKLTDEEKKLLNIH